MIDIKLLERKTETEDSFESYRKNLEDRAGDLSLLNEVMLLNKKRKEAITEAETLKAQQNKLNQQIPLLKKQNQDVSQLMEDLKKMSSQVKLLEASATQTDQIVFDKLAYLPNRLHADVPVGKSAEQNVVVKTVGEKTSFSFKAKEHWELGEKLKLLDFDRAAKVSGTRFAYLRGSFAQLERALIQFFLDTHTLQNGYEEILTPFIVNSRSLFGTNQFPKMKEDVFHLSGTDQYLIPTAEVPVTNFYNDEILDESTLPQRFSAYSPCFRSEAGSHGRDTKGLIRQHQFNKVELMIFARPDQSDEWHEKLTQHAEGILEALGLPYRRMLLCSGDISFGAAKCFDLEVWLPGPQQYREISSCSNFLDFQARRANIRFKSAAGKPQFVHTINGSGLAVGRTLIAVVENYQNEDGSIKIPKVLQKYMNGKSVIQKMDSAT